MDVDRISSIIAKNLTSGITRSVRPYPLVSNPFRKFNNLWFYKHTLLHIIIQGTKQFKGDYQTIGASMPASMATREPTT